jgi:hypothetical protein
MPQLKKLFGVVSSERYTFSGFKKCRLGTKDLMFEKFNNLLRRIHKVISTFGTPC